MRRIRYQVACSLDGYIAGPRGEYDWIVMDPDIDFQGMMSRYDTVLMGRKTFESSGGGASSGMTTYVFSRTLRQKDHPDVIVVSGDVPALLAELRSAPGRDIWLFGGGELLRSLLALGGVDTVEPAVIPVLLGGGRPLLPEPRRTYGLPEDGHGAAQL